MNMGQVFDRAVKRRPKATAIVDRHNDVEYTYQEWYNHATSVASALEEDGIGAGDRVAAVMRNRAELATLYCASQLLGAVFLPYNYRSSADELTYLVNNSGADILFFGKTTGDAVTTAYEDFADDPDLVSVDEEYDFAVHANRYFQAEQGDFEPTIVAANKPSLILHTGGTTGRPKGVLRSHENTYAAAMAHAVQTSWSPGETTLGLMSLSHTMGIHGFAAILLLGGTWVSQWSFSPEQTVSLIEEEKITSLYLVPTVYHDLTESDIVTEADFSSVESIAFAGSSMSVPDIRTIEERVDPDTFVNHYGSTEVYTHTTCDYINKKTGCAGRAGINTRVRVVEPSDFGELDPTATVAATELGEIIVNTDSPEAFQEYLSSEPMERTVVDGWFFTGDLGYRDEVGDLFVVGRIDDMIISGGENIYPVEVENVLEKHESVTEAAVVGRPSDRWNQTVVAFVAFDQSSDDIDFESFANTLDTRCQESGQLADFKRPRKYFFIDHLAKSNVGKILRKELQKKDLDIPVHAEVGI
ncbi:long-chain fatty acid--CoA ligase [halophilic archaeon]|nr:long-chain fatty acid--CoA ligase [halophilic archaeon]